MLRSDRYRLFIDLGLKVAKLSLNIVESSNLLGEGPLESRSLRVQLYEIECQPARHFGALQKMSVQIAEDTAFQDRPSPQGPKVCSLLLRSSTRKKQYVHLGIELHPLPPKH